MSKMLFNTGLFNLIDIERPHSESLTSVFSCSSNLGELVCIERKKERNCKYICFERCILNVRGFYQ